MTKERTLDIIEKMLTGQIEMPAFISALCGDASMQNTLREILPSDAVNNPQHELWKRISYDSFKQNGFDFVRFLKWICRFDGSFGDNLNLFATIRIVYTYANPYINCTTYYSDVFDLYLDVVKDCYDGLEVRALVQESLKEALKEPTKGKRIQKAKEIILELFHADGKNRPRWIQGPEWPMGQQSPMKFVSQKRKGECVCYYFVDVDSNEERTVTEFY